MDQHLVTPLVCDDAGRAASEPPMYWYNWSFAFHALRFQAAPRAVCCLWFISIRLKSIPTHSTQPHKTIAKRGFTVIFCRCLLRMMGPAHNFDIAHLRRKSNGMDGGEALYNRKLSLSDSAALKSDWLDAATTVLVVVGWLCSGVVISSVAFK